MRLDPFQRLVLQALAAIINLLLRMRGFYERDPFADQTGRDCEEGARKGEL